MQTEKLTNKLMFLDKTSVSSFNEWIELANLSGGALLIDKDLKWTSFDVIAKLRNLLKIRKIGHAGTLDPLATGLLIICCGKATKSINQFQGLNKTYLAKIKIGATTETDDSEKDEENIKDYSFVTKDDIINACKSFEGKILQRPPAYSAKKVKGKRLYQLARQGIKVEIEPVEVFVDYIKILNIELPNIDIEVKCSKGTYIRALARDIGEKLGTGAYLASLRRIKIGDYSIEKALKITEIQKLITGV